MSKPGKLVLVQTTNPISPDLHVLISVCVHMHAIYSILSYVQIHAFYSILSHVQIHVTTTTAII